MSAPTIISISGLYSNKRVKLHRVQGSEVRCSDSMTLRVTVAPDEPTNVILRLEIVDKASSVVFDDGGHEVQTSVPKGEHEIDLPWQLKREDEPVLVRLKLRVVAQDADPPRASRLRNFTIRLEEPS